MLLKQCDCYYWWMICSQWDRVDNSAVSCPYIEVYCSNIFPTATGPINLIFKKTTSAVSPSKSDWVHNLFLTLADSGRALPITPKQTANTCFYTSSGHFYVVGPRGVWGKSRGRDTPCIPRCVPRVSRDQSAAQLAKTHVRPNFSRQLLEAGQADLLTADITSTATLGWPSCTASRSPPPLVSRWPGSQTAVYRHLACTLCTGAGHLGYTPCTRMCHGARRLPDFSIF